MSDRTYARGQSRRRGWLSRHTVVASILAAGGILLVGTQFGEAGLATWLQLRAQDKELNAEVGALQEANNHLAQDLDAVLHDPEALERLAREEHNMQGADEEVLTVLPEDFSSPDQP